MSDRQNDVLAAIDGALDDWTVSGDAMRWTPPDVEPDGPCTCTVAERCDRHSSELDFAVKQMLRFGDLWTGAAQRFCDSVAEAFVNMPAAEAAFPALGPRPTSDSIPARLSPAEAMLPGPDGTAIHIRGAYGDQPAQITQLNPDDIEGERT